MVWTLQRQSVISYRTGNDSDAPSTRRFLVAEGRVILELCIARVTLTWHPRRDLWYCFVRMDFIWSRNDKTDVSVSPNAMSSISFSSSEGSSSWSYTSESRMTWQVEHAIDFSQAAVEDENVSGSFFNDVVCREYCSDWGVAWICCRCLVEVECGVVRSGVRTFNVEIVFPWNIDNIVPFIRFYRFNNLSRLFLKDQCNPEWLWLAVLSVVKCNSLTLPLASVSLCRHALVLCIVSVCEWQRVWWPYENNLKMVESEALI